MIHKEEIKYTLISNYENESIACGEQTNSTIVESNPECFQLLIKKINSATAKPQTALREDDKVIWGNKTRIKSIRKRLTHVLERDSTKWYEFLKRIHEYGHLPSGEANLLLVSIPSTEINPRKIMLSKFMRLICTQKNFL